MTRGDLLEAIADDLAVALEAVASATVSLSRLSAMVADPGDGADCGRPLTEAEVAASPRHRAALAKFQRIGRAYESAEALLKARAAEAPP